jgi:hypothetical protein
MIPSGIETANFRVLAQCLNQMRHQKECAIQWSRAKLWQEPGIHLEERTVNTASCCLELASIRALSNTTQKRYRLNHLLSHYRVIKWKTIHKQKYSVNVSFKFKTGKIIVFTAKKVRYQRMDCR